MPHLLTRKETILLSVSVSVLLTSSAILFYRFYLNNTRLYPKAGGIYTEAVIGEPQYINPILAQTNDTDQDLAQLIFSGLLKYDREANLLPALAERYEIASDQRTYIFYLKKNISWQDGKPLTADDVIFTIKLIQDPAYKSPLRISWQGVQAEKLDDYSLRFILSNTYAPFLENTTVGILPKHVWESVSAANFTLADYNLKPIGSGPYQFKKLEKDKTGSIKSYTLEVNQNYFGQKPFIKTVIFKFFPDIETAIGGYNRNLVSGISFVLPQNKNQIRKVEDLAIYKLNLPRYFAVFLNYTQNKALGEKDVRLALAYATNKEEIISQILKGEGFQVEGPILPNLLGYTPATKIYEFAPEHSKNLLASAGWRDEDQDGFREKKNDPLKVTLVTSDWPELGEVANLLKNQWERVGIRIEVKTLSISEIQQDYIRPRNYEALLFGEVLGADPDPFSFWHSSQKKDPGLNLSLYENPTIDKLLEEARQTIDQNLRAKKYESFYKQIIEDVPAIFLYSPYYLYGVNKKVKGINPEEIMVPAGRFSQIEDWYINTRRSWK